MFNVDSVFVTKSLEELRELFCKLETEQQKALCDDVIAFRNDMFSRYAPEEEKTPESEAIEEVAIQEAVDLLFLFNSEDGIEET